MQARKKFKWTDNGYVFVNEVAVKKNVQKKLHCGDTVKTNYYNPSTGTIYSIIVA